MADERFTKWRDGLVHRGTLGPLRLGVSQEDVTETLGPPDLVSTAKKKGKPVILKYADIEFHFDHLAGHRLCLIYSEDAGVSIR